MEMVRPPWIDWAVASMTLHGERASGDRHVVQPFRTGVVVAVIDGLGHGFEAAHAAALAVSTVERHAGEPVVSLVSRCHQVLRGTRGAVISLASYSACDHRMTWVAVGNVEGLLRRATGNSDEPDRSLLLRGGVVGTRLPPLSADVVSVRDLLILASDGIGSEFAGSIVATDSTQQIADRILAAHGKATDDALVLVSRYVGDRGAPR
jgi:negative regulator of sigma-B (phosphoserine phosphatase)